MLLAATGTARADELSSLKADVESLNQRLAALDVTSATPERALVVYGAHDSFIGILPSADAPKGASISWSGMARAGLVYNRVEEVSKSTAYVLESGDWIHTPQNDSKDTDSRNETDVEARGQIMVQAETGTSVGDVGLKLKYRGDFYGNGAADFYNKTAWGYWSMTRDLSLGGGYNSSIGNINYGYDGSCTCEYTDHADVSFNPGDTTQFRLTYASGPLTAAIALEDASLDDDMINSGLLGVAGQLAYSHGMFSGEISGDWRDSDRSQTGSSEIWQVGVGGGVKAEGTGSLTFAAAAGQGPYEVTWEGSIVSGLAYDNNWWGASAFSSLDLADTSHVELAGGYKHRDGDQPNYEGYSVSEVSYETYAVLTGVYYQPVAQLTLGLEGEWYRTESSANARKDSQKFVIEAESDTFWADAVAVWSF